MTHNFDPLPRVVEHCTTLDLTWQEVERDLVQGHNTPAPGQPGKRRIVGEKVEAIVAEAEEPPRLIVLYVRPRRRLSMEEAEYIIGRQRERGERGLRKAKGGGSGRRWPTTFRELIRLAERNKGVRVVQGSKHHIVLKDGQQVAVLPLTASDHRSLMNASRQLDKAGIDVRRTA